MLLVGRDLSPFVRRTAIVLDTLKIAVDRQKLAAIEDGEILSRLTPLGRVPVLVLDDGETLIDSAAIADYALEIADSDYRLLPESGSGRRRVRYLCAVAPGAMDKGVAASYERYRRPKEKIHQPWLDRLFDQLRRGAAALEAAAHGREWLHGEGMTLADIDAVVLYDFVQLLKPRLASDAAPSALPALSARLNALPAFRDNRHRPASARVKTE